MHFLCLHGLGTNSKVLETQTAAIRAELGDEHTYDFVDGTVPWPKAEELGGMFADDDEYLAYYDPYSPESVYRGLLQLEKYIEVEGPFDGVIAFSQGGAMATSLLLGRNAEGTPYTPFKCAIFLAAGVPWSLEALQHNELVRLDKSFATRLSIPTAHVYASNDIWGDMSETVEALCAPQVRHGYVHELGHTIPGRRTPEILKSSLSVIRRALWEVDAGS